MARPPRFYEADLKRLIASAQKSGLRDYRIDILPDGTMSIVVGSGASAPIRGNSCDDLLD